MTVKKGKKPTNKERDHALTIHDAMIRETARKHNSLYNQVQDFFAVFSMFVELLGKEDDFAEYIQKKIEDGKNAKEKEVKILDKDGNPSENDIKANKVVADGS